MKEKKNCILVKHYRKYPDKIIYRGPLKRAKKRIPPSKKGQFSIHFVGDGKTENDALGEE